MFMETIIGIYLHTVLISIILLTVVCIGQIITDIYRLLFSEDNETFNVYAYYTFFICIAFVMILDYYIHNLAWLN